MCFVLEKDPVIIEEEPEHTGFHPIVAMTILDDNVKEQVSQTENVVSEVFPIGFFEKFYDDDHSPTN